MSNEQKIQQTAKVDSRKTKINPFSLLINKMGI